MPTRSQRKRIYSWIGKAIYSDDQLQVSHYRGISVKSEKSGVDIFPGDFVLIEGKDKDQHFVARLVKLYENGSQEKHAVVQWFSRLEELPLCQQMSLGEESSQEIFLNENAERDTDIIATSIITSFTVIPLSLYEELPTMPKNDFIFFLRKSWDGKKFKPLPPGLLAELKDSGKIKKKNLNFAAEDPQTPSGTVSFLEEDDESVARNTRRSKNKTEMKSRPSASKSPLSKQRHSQRIAHGTETPGAKKKLQLNSPTKSPRIKFTERDLIELLDCDFVEPLEQSTLKRKVSFTGIKGSPSKISCTIDEEDLFVDIKPLSRKSGRNSTDVKSASQGIQDSSMKAKNSSVKENVSCSDGVATQDKICKTPQKSKDIKNEGAIPKSFRKNQQSLEEQPVSDARNPLLTPRSRRKCAQVTAIRIAQQFSTEQTSGDSDSEDDYLSPLDNSDSSGSSDEEYRKTPKQQMKSSSKISKDPAAHTPTKSPCKTSEPRTPKTPRNATPRIRSRKQAAQKPANILEETRIRLHVSAVPETLPCREKEFQDIYNFIESKLIDGTGGCMYISGVPGTGKTATVHEVIRCLEQAAESNELPSFQFVEINGMKLTDPHQAYVQILKLLTGQKASATHAAVLLEKMFCTPKSKRKPIILVVDELDLLWTRKQNVMYNLFDWPTQKHAKLIVLAIANTMDLPERIMLNRVSSRLGLTRMSFQPYTYKQLQQIILSRMGKLKTFEEDAIQFVSRKVAALSGDARRCLDICRRSTEICELPSQKNACGIVRMAHVMEAIDEMFSSPYISTIRNASLQEQTFLKAIIAEFRRSGLEEATVQQVFQQHVALCRIEGLQTPTVSDIMAISSRLSACRLLLAESSHKYLLMRLRLNVSQDDVMYALKEE